MKSVASLESCILCVIKTPPIYNCNVDEKDAHCVALEELIGVTSSTNNHFMQH